MDLIDRFGEASDDPEVKDLFEDMRVIAKGTLSLNIITQKLLIGGKYITPTLCR